MGGLEHSANVFPIYHIFHMYHIYDISLFSTLSILGSRNGKTRLLSRV